MEFVPMCPPEWDGGIQELAAMHSACIHALNLPRSPPIGFPILRHHIIKAQRAIAKPLWPLDQSGGGTRQTNSPRFIMGQHGLVKLETALLGNKAGIKREKRVIIHQPSGILANVVCQVLKVTRKIGDGRHPSVTKQQR